MPNASPGRRISRPLRAAFCVLLIAPVVLAQAASPPARSPQRFGQVPPFRFVERSGVEVGLDDLLGAPWIAVPFFVGCTGPCPTVTTDLRGKLLGDLADTPVRIVSFSVDPEFDTAERLREYAAQYSIVDDGRWLFLTGERPEMERFLREGLGIPLDRSEEAEAEYGESITHGTRLPVIDAAGRIAGWYEVSRAALGDDPGLAQQGLAALRDRALALAAPAGGSRLPLLNATLNGTACLLLLAGWLAIRSDRRRLHELLMKGAFVTSALFLVSYLYYHGVVQRAHGPVRYNGVGWTRTAYLAMLASHIVLAIVNLPMVLRTLWLAHREDWDRHRRLARKTFPIWLYVSVTGVLVYLVLYPWNPPPAA